MLGCVIYMDHGQKSCVILLPNHSVLKIQFKSWHDHLPTELVYSTHQFEYCLNKLSN